MERLTLRCLKVPDDGGGVAVYSFKDDGGEDPGRTRAESDEDQRSNGLCAHARRRTGSNARWSRLTGEDGDGPAIGRWRRECEMGNSDVYQLKEDVVTVEENAVIRSERLPGRDENVKDQARINPRKMCDGTPKDP